jgi:hypothetical protein
VTKAQAYLGTSRACLHHGIDEVSWTQEPGEGAAVVPFDQYKSGGFGRFVRMNNGKSEVLEFIVLTKAPKSRLHVYSSKYCIRVYKESRLEGGGGAEDTESLDEESDEMLQSDAADNENVPSAEQVASEREVLRDKKSRSQWWSASSDRPLNTAEMKVECIKNDDGNPVAIRVLAPVETGEHDKGSSRGSSKPSSKRWQASKKT